MAGPPALVCVQRRAEGAGGVKPPPGTAGHRGAFVLPYTVAVLGLAAGRTVCSFLWAKRLREPECPFPVETWSLFWATVLGVVVICCHSSSIGNSAWALGMEILEIQPGSAWMSALAADSKAGPEPVAEVPLGEVLNARCPIPCSSPWERGMGALPFWCQRLLPLDLHVTFRALVCSVLLCTHLQLSGETLTVERDSSVDKNCIWPDKDFEQYL